MWMIILASILAFLIYYIGIKPMKYWEEQRIPFVKPYPFVGSMLDILFQRRANAYVLENIYNSFPNRRYFGYYNFTIPTLMIRDPDLIKRITVKEFDSFNDHRPFISDGVDPLWSNNLFAMRGDQRWHDVRSTLSPSFTSNKMRMMFQLMKECSKQFTNYFQKQNGIVTVEMKDAFTRFTNDVIATTAFGVSCDSLGERENEFYLMGIEATDFTGIKGLRFLVSSIMPTLAKLLEIRIITKRVGLFFTGLIKDAIILPEEKSIMRPDMIHLLMEARKDRLKQNASNGAIADLGFAVSQEEKTTKIQKRQKSEITDDDIVAQALIFSFAGFESVATMMCFAAHELVVNPDVQDKLRKEIDKILEKYNDDFTYEAIMEMKYLDMVVTETLRKWPPFPQTDRKVVKLFTIQPENPGEKPLHLKVDTICVLPIYAIQRDPQYYSNPDKLDPERYADENKHNDNPFTYIPFGAGPRNCIASRFALLEGKLLIAEIISKFEIIPVEKTQIPIKLGRRTFNNTITVDEGFWLGLKPRFISR